MFGSSTQSIADKNDFQIHRSHYDIEIISLWKELFNSKFRRIKYIDWIIDLKKLNIIECVRSAFLHSELCPIIHSDWNF